MSEYSNLVRNIVKENKMTMDDLLALEDKVWNTLKHQDLESYNEFMGVLEGAYYSINREEAEKIVRAMKPYGEFWSYEQIKDYLKEKDIDDCLDYYLAMNMVRNDYYDTAKKYMLQDDTEFYFSLAQDFLVDDDAKPFKVAKYFK